MQLTHYIRMESFLRFENGLLLGNLLIYYKTAVFQKTQNMVISTDVKKYRIQSNIFLTDEKETLRKLRP